MNALLHPPAAPGPLVLACVQYPDPSHHVDRCVASPPLAEALAALLAPDGRVFLQSDDFTTAVYMRDVFQRHAGGALRVADVHGEQDAVFYRDAPLAGTAAAAALAVAGNDGLRDSANKSSGDGAVAGCSGQQSASEQSAGSSGGSEALGSGDGQVAAVMGWQSAGWLKHNPIGVPTEREVYVEKVTKGEVYRLLLQRRD